VLRSGNAAVEIDAEPEAAYDVLADVTRMGELSEECENAVWVDGADGPAIGARFRSSIRYRHLRWHRICEVLAAERGREFAYRTLPTGPLRHITEFRFRFGRQGEVTHVTADSVLVRAGLVSRVLTRLIGRPEALQRDLEAMLGRLKTLAERAPRRQD
jgi:hypothetical protein